jgi:hypothetical protein
MSATFNFFPMHYSLGPVNLSVNKQQINENRLFQYQVSYCDNLLQYIYNKIYSVRKKEEINTQYAYTIEVHCFASYNIQATCGFLSNLCLLVERVKFS